MIFPKITGTAFLLQKKHFGPFAMIKDIFIDLFTDSDLT